MTDEISHKQTFARSERKKIVLVTSGLAFATGSLILLLGLAHQSLEKVIIAGSIFLIAIGFAFAYKDRLFPAEIITSLVVFITSSYFLIEGEGVHDSSMAGYLAVVIVPGLLLGEAGALIFGVLSTLVLMSLSYAEAAGLFATPYTSFFDTKDYNTVWVLHLALSLLIFTVIRHFSAVTNKAQNNEQILHKANKELSELRDNLQRRIKSRTKNLEDQNQKLQSASIVERELLDIQDSEELLKVGAKLIAEEFSYYHVGIFLINKRGDYAVLQAASSLGGEEMLARGHRLKIGSEGVVGAAAAEKRPRIALDVGEDAVYFNNPSLPQTHSEMALPMIVQGSVIGILDVQSEQAQAFTQADAAVLQTLANQLSLMLQNTRLIEEAETSIAQLELLTEGQMQQAWRTYLSDDRYGFRYTPLGIKRMTGSQIAFKSGDDNVTEIPIMLRDTKIGRFYLKREGQNWTAKERVLMNAVIRQVGLAIENARLVSQTRAQALQEQLASDFTTKLRETLDMDTVVKTAIKEVQNTFSLKEVEIRMNTKMDES